jgi:sugar phosphate isomerase/epimerase
MPPVLSVQLYSIRDAIAADLDTALERIASIGLTAVEPYGFVDRAEDFGRALAANGLSAPSAHAPVIDGGDAAPTFAAAANLGVQILIDPYIPPERWQTLDDAARLADRVNALAAQAEAGGLRFGYHNHQWELVTQIGGRPILDAFIDRLNPAVVLELDTFWATVGGADVPALLRRLGDRVPLIHVKDGRLPSGSAAPDAAAIATVLENQLPAGSGDVDVPSILAAARNATRVIEFDQYAGDVFDGIAASASWLRENDPALTD